MKVICKDKTVDTDHFEKVQYQESVIGGCHYKRPCITGGQLRCGTLGNRHTNGNTNYKR